MNQATPVAWSSRNDLARSQRAEMINAQYERASSIAMSGFICGLFAGASVAYIAARMVCGVA